MNYCGLNFCDTANGDGVRVSLFVSGCTLHCKECFNKELWNFNYGKLFTNEVKESIIKALKNPYIKGFSLLGGDPFEYQHFDVLLDLLKTIKKECPNKDVWVWTGRQFKNIKDSELLKYIDVLIDGPFIKELKNTSLKYRGSSNQNIIHINCLKF